MLVEEGPAEPPLAAMASAPLTEYVRAQGAQIAYVTYKSADSYGN